MIEDDTLVAAIAVSAQYEGLHSELHRSLGQASTLQFLTSDARACNRRAWRGRRRTREVELCNDAVFLGRESDGADDRGFGGDIAGRGRGAAFLVDALMLRGSLSGVLIVNKDALDLLEIEQPRAVSVLVDLAGREIVGERAS